MASISKRWLRAIAAGMFLPAVCAITGFSMSSPAEAAPAITWRLENPFRFFIDPNDTNTHREIYRALGPRERATPVLSEEHALQRDDRDGWAASTVGKTCWSDNRFKCKAYDDYINPSRHAVLAKVSGIDDASALSCTWYSAPRGDAQNPRGDAITQPCNEPARFVIPYPGGAMLTVEIGGRQIGKADIKVRDILIAGMGDSFASGEGNPDMPVRFSRERSADYSTLGMYASLTGYPARIGPWRELGDAAFIKENARWLDQACHRSLYSGQLRSALQLAVEDPHRAVTFVGVSCAGAEITDGLFLQYKGNEWVPNPPKFSQLSAVAEAQCGKNKTDKVKLTEAYDQNGEVPQLEDLVMRQCPQDVARKIDLVLLSIGGNDIGFSRLIANTVLSNESLLRELGGWLGQIHSDTEASQALGNLAPRYKALNRALHALLYVPWEESDRILLVAYPGLALQGDGSQMCGSGNAGMDVVPDFQLDRTKLKLGIWYADKLNRQMRDSAGEFGWTFVETHRRSFIGRSICDGLSVEGVSEVDDLRLPRKIDGMWTPYNPAEYQPYAARQRWFRTPNDAFMTGNFHAAAGFLTRYLKIEPFAPFQAILASTYSGAFHPTAEGQAAIADAVVDKARTVLAKYGQGPDADPTGYTVPSPNDLPPPVAEPNVAMPDVKSVLSKLPATPADANAKGAITGAIPPRAPAPDDSDIGAPDAQDTPTTIETIGVTSGSPDSQPPPDAAASPAPSDAAATSATTGQPIELRRSAIPAAAVSTPAPPVVPTAPATTATTEQAVLPPIAVPPPATASGPAVSQSPAAVETKALAPMSTGTPAASDDEFAPKPFAPAASK
jgi:lysophospholipase L1-like esterase